MKKALFAAALVLALPAMAPAYGSDMPAFGQEKIVGLMGQSGGIVILKQDEGAGDFKDLQLVGTYGLSIFGAGPVGWIEKKQAVALIDMNIILPAAIVQITTPFDDIEQIMKLGELPAIASKDYGIVIREGGGESGSTPMANNGTDAARYVDVIKDHRGPVAPFQRGAEQQLKGGIYVETA